MPWRVGLMTMSKDRPDNPWRRVRKCWVDGCKYETRPTSAGQAESRLKEHMNAKHPGEWD